MSGEDNYWTRRLQSGNRLAAPSGWWRGCGGTWRRGAGPGWLRRRQLVVDADGGRKDERGRHHCRWYHHGGCQRLSLRLTAG